MGLILGLGLGTFVGAIVIEIWLRLDDRVRKLEGSRRPWGGVVESWDDPEPFEQFTSGVNRG